MTVDQPIRLSSLPDWHYVIQEFYYAYRYGSAAGSKAIRGHMRAVQTRLTKLFSTDPEIRLQTPKTMPVCAHLSRVLDNGEQHAAQAFVRAVGKVTPQLNWQHGYDKMPKSLERKYAYAEIMGPQGPVVSPDLILGLVLFAPRCTYPAHSHEAITESYICLSGFVSENDAGVYPPGALILNQPEHPHSITTSDREPVLLAYAWVGDPDVLSTFKMSFSQAIGPELPGPYDTLVRTAPDTRLPWRNHSRRTWSFAILIHSLLRSLRSRSAVLAGQQRFKGRRANRLDCHIWRRSDICQSRL